ncbi:MAG: transglycosylase domain-containing protein [Bacteroidia bacterium]|nr:transglycosylase domain-containing protein [Bacteroidia bacterium]
MAVQKGRKGKQNVQAKKYIRWIWLFFTGPVLLVLLVVLLTMAGLFGKLPTIEDLANPRSNLASEIISSDQEVIGKFYVENRSNIRYEELPPHLVEALISTEDARFYSHSGIDLQALFRVLVRTILGGDSGSGGGSTITQQLAKNMFPRESLNTFQVIFRKIKEWIIAIKLERNFTKQEIIALYFNTVDFGNQAYGIKSASKVFFNCEPKELKAEEAAMLVGLLKGPSYYNPRRNYERAVLRRNVVLNQMVRFGDMQPAAYDSLKALPIDLSRFQAESHTAGIATYFREFLREQLSEWCKTHKKPDGGTYNLYKDGLKIYTTINARMQRYAEEAVQEHLKGLQKEFFAHWKGHKQAPFTGIPDSKIQQIMTQAMQRSERYRRMKEDGLSEKEIEQAFRKKTSMKIFTWNGDSTVNMSPWDSIRYHKYILQTGMMSVEPQTGYVRTWVGGINQRYFQYDHVYRGKRQVGSTFKSFVYAVAMQEGWSPCTQVPNLPICIPTPSGPWCPDNSSKDYEGSMVPLKSALAHSINRVSAFLIKQFGVQPVIKMVRRMGISSPIDPVPSICLGTPDISVYEMVGAMSAFANQGVYVEPTWLMRIEDKNGNVLEDFRPRIVEALDEQTAYLVVELMKGVVEGGTAARLRGRYGLTNPIAGKTGTTQNNSDGWFMGLTPDLVSGVWVGCEDRAAHFRSTALGQGANTALPIWGIFMKKVYADKKLRDEVGRGDFKRPAHLSVEIDCSKYQQENLQKNEIENFDQ